MQFGNIPLISFDGQIVQYNLHSLDQLKDIFTIIRKSL